ncbi:hypothetical protein MMC14_009019 [Varicellaria rhodocarpa]|nr:hypothetical protein [Varicellaria rhodocarpa]
MADALHELLVPYFDKRPSQRSQPKSSDPVAAKYLNRLSTLQLESLKTTEPQSLAQSSHSALLSLQSLSSRSSKALISSADHLGNLHTILPKIAENAHNLRDGVTTLDQEALGFSEKYSRSGENEVLDRRKKALLMSRNVDRLSDILDLPNLLSSTVSSSAIGSSNTTNYGSALDLHSHIKRLRLLYQDSRLLESVYAQAEEIMREMTSNLITSLQFQNIKLAAGMRTIGWLRRIAPEIDGGYQLQNSHGGEGSLGVLFLICRLSNLISMLQALSPLRELADQESQRRLYDKGVVANGNMWSGGQQTERYLKRYIEIFREQSFAIISVFKSIFPSTETSNDDLRAQFKSLGLQNAQPERLKQEDDPLQPLPSALSSFPMHLVDLLADTLKQYLPNVRDKSSRESLLTQVMYCAGSLGRLSGDFSMILADLQDDDSDDEEDEWVVVMKKHRMLAGRLELLASSVGSHGKGTGDDTSKSFATKT